MMYFACVVDGVVVEVVVVVYVVCVVVACVGVVRGVAFVVYVDFRR